MHLIGHLHTFSFRRFFLNDRYTLLTLGLLAALLGYSQISSSYAAWRPMHYLSLHTLVEMASIILALMAVGALIMGYQRQIPRAIVLMATLYGLSALFDLLHTLTFPGMPAFLGQPASMDLTLRYWILGRFCSVGALLIAGFAGSALWPARSRWYGCGFGALFFMTTCLIIMQDTALPVLYENGNGLTTPKILVEWAFVVASLCAGALLYVNRQLASFVDTHQLAAAAWITGLSEICFTLYASSYDGYSLIGHVYKLIAYALVFRATFLASLKQPYSQLAQAKQTLAHTEQRWQYALNGSKTGVWDYDVLKNDAYHSPQTHRMLGHTNLEILNGPAEHIWAQVHPDDLPGLKQVCHRHLYDGAPAIHHEYRLLDAHGHWVWVEAHGQAMEHDDQHQPLRVVGTITIIDQRKEQEWQLEQTQGRLQAMFDASPLGMALIDSEGTIQESNSAMAELFPHTQAPLKKARLFNGLDGKDVRRLLVDWREYIAPPRETYLPVTFRREYQLDTAAGSNRWIEWNLLALANEPLYLVLVEDINERRHATDLLTENAALYQGIFESGNAIKLLIDPVHGAIYDANPLAADYYGHDLSTLRTMTIQALSGEPESNVKQRLMQAQLHSILQFETTHRTAHGEYRAVEVHIGPVRIEGYLLMFCIVHDIEDRKRAEQALSRANARLKAQGLSRKQLTSLSKRMHGATTFDDLASVIAHDIPFCFPGTQGVLHLTIEELSDPIEREWAPERPINVTFTVLEDIMIGERCIGSLELDTPLEDAVDQEWLQQYARDCINSMILAVLNLRLLERLHQEAYRDPLTKLYNRRQLDSELPTRLSAASDTSPLTLVFLDIDHFKTLNDTYGHDMGDEVLRRLAGMIEQCLGAADMACRFGGEEFVLVMSNESMAGAYKRVQSLLDGVMSEKVASNGHMVEGFSFSAGIAQATRPARNPAILIEHADSALYQAKAQGRARIVCATEHPLSYSR
ncbi:MASE3 domain-containing protein [Larsenimonas salina]|uniref:MASE3 domain-containing protein n=1 Tax=Larsenimonas salina TaxID=1295565 RepID=UPI0020749435|nr:MASE3 domain-containing protein [Larsenimonas salina]MCM5705027.1 diguanylate cyclase [Larsenimonas salina]